MLHLLSLRYTGTEADAGPHVPAHVRYLERWHANGIFLVSGQTVPSSDGGVIVACGVDHATIEEISEQDPFVVAGVGRYTITTIEPGRMHPALAQIPGVSEVPMEQR